MSLSQCNEAIEVFFSYSHRDEDLRNELVKHLGLLQRQGIISVWHDRKIDAGTEWKQAIDTHLQTASVILLLISADFLASDYCYELEMQRAMERHDAGEARVIPVILRAVDWHSAPFGKLQALPVDGKPVTSWSNRDEAFMQVAQGIRAVAAKLTAKTSLSSVAKSITEVSVGTMEIEITIDRDFESYTKADQDHFLRAICEFLQINSDLRVKRKRRSSVKITLELSREQAEKLYQAIKSGDFDHYDVIDAELKEIPGAKQPSRILLVEVHVMLRQGLRVLLEHAGMIVVGEASDGLEALRLAHEYRPAIAMVDIDTPHWDDLEMIRRLHEVVPQTKIIVLTMHTEEPLVRDALQAGTVGYVLKTQAAADIVEAIHTVLQGGIYLSPQVMNAVWNVYITGSILPPIPRELDIFQRMVEGQTLEEIAELLGMSVQDVESHQISVKQKLGIQ